MTRAASSVRPVPSLLLHHGVQLTFRAVEEAIHTVHQVKTAPEVLQLAVFVRVVQARSVHAWWTASLSCRRRMTAWSGAGRGVPAAQLPRG
jgi:hypothetical protein